MKIGVMTFWESSNNYGQILQLFALQKFLIKLGHEPFLIKYYRIPSERKKVLLLHKMGIYNLLLSIKNMFVYEEDYKRKFKEFKQNNIVFGKKNYYSLDELKNNPPTADVYITGSDQVWNNNFSVSAEAFLLGFGLPETKIISYAASFGVKKLDDLTQKMFKDHLIQFSGISVREQSGLDIIKSLGVDGAEWVLDPTLLFTKSDWMRLLNLKEENIYRKSIFIYTLGHSEIIDKEKFINYANSLKDYTVVHASANNDGVGNYYPTIQEWVSGIKNSHFVITTSFHGMVFCIINNTNFIVLPSRGKKEGMNERILSLLKLLDLEEHISSEFSKEKFDYLFNKTINWSAINKVIQEKRILSISYLTSNLKF